MIKTRIISYLDSCGNEVPAEQTPEQEEAQVSYITSEMTDLRQIVVQYMYDMANIEWTAGPLIDYSFNNKSLIYRPGEKYLGMIYNNCRNGLEAFKKALNENGTYALEDVGWDTAPGNSCATSIKHAWQMISPDVEYQYSVDMMPCYKETGVLPVGNINWAAYDGKNTTDSVLKNTDKKDVLEAYAMALPGDGFMRYLDHGGHALMVTLKPVVVRCADGSVNPQESFVFLTDQNNVLNTIRGYPSSWKIDHKISFEKAYVDGWLPVTVKELREGKAPVPVCEITGAPTGKALASGNGLKGSVKCNYCLMTVRAEIRKNNAVGEVVTVGEVHPYTRSFDLRQMEEKLAWREIQAGSYWFILTVAVGLGKETLAELQFEK